MAQDSTEGWGQGRREQASFKARDLRGPWDTSALPQRREGGMGTRKTGLPTLTGTTTAPARST